MRIKLALAGGTGLVLALVEGWYQVCVVIFVCYVGWTWLRIPIERRTRLRQIDPTWHRGREYDREGDPQD